MKNDIEVIKSRIAKLKKHAESAAIFGSVEEAATFTLKVSELLLEYNLLESDINMSDDSDKFKNWTYSEKLSFQCKQSGQRAKLELVGVLCKHNLCNYIWQSRAKTFEVYGKVENVDQVVWLYNYLSVGLLRLAQQAHVDALKNQTCFTNRYSFLKNFLIGAAQGIDKQLEKQKRESIRYSDTTSLIKVNKDDLLEYVTKTTPNVKEVTMKIIKVGQGYNQGIEAGESYSINKPIESIKTKTKLL